MKITPIKFAKGFYADILSGVKTQTRRVVKDGEGHCRYGMPGDVLECDLLGKSVRLVITSVDQQRIQDITYPELFSEGLYSMSDFMVAWKLLCGPDSWDNNDLVWAITFELETPSDVRNGK